VVIILATWRLSHMVGREDGPGDIFKQLKLACGARYAANLGWQGSTMLSKLVVCPLCISVWFALSLVVVHAYCEWLWPAVIVLAISGAASWLELVLQLKDGGK